MALDVESGTDEMPDQQDEEEENANDIFKHTMVNVQEPQSARFNDVPATKREDHES